MQPSILKACINARVQAHLSGTRIRPLLLKGSPGVGKTQLFAQVANDLGIGFKAMHAPLMLNEDFGMPTFRDNGEIDFATPGNKFPFLDSPDCPETGIMLVDEVAQADAGQQKIWANIFQERELHGRKLKPGWYIGATGNRIEDRAGANRILSHFNDRFTTYDLEPNLDDWCDWALDHGIRPEVVSFCRWKPGLLSKPDPTQDKYPTPRAWSEGVSPTLDVVAHAALLETIKGDVGEGAAAEFLGFLDTYRALPDPDLIIRNPTTHPIPSEVHILFALCGALAHRIDVDNCAAIFTYAARMAPEFMVLVVRDAIKVCPEVENTKACIALYTGPLHAIFTGR